MKMQIKMVLRMTMKVELSDLNNRVDERITNNSYKFMYLNSEVKQGQRHAYYCTYRSVIDDTSSEEYKQRTQTVSSFVRSNVFLFDLTFDYKESTIIMTSTTTTETVETGKTGMIKMIIMTMMIMC